MSADLKHNLRGIILDNTRLSGAKARDLVDAILVYVKADQERAAELVAQASAAPDALDAARYRCLRTDIWMNDDDWMQLSYSSAVDFDRIVDARLAATESNKGE